MQIDLAKKQSIILQLGSEWIQIGLVTDKYPRKSIKAGNVMCYDQKTGPSQILIQSLLFNIMFCQLNCPCQGKTIVILEKVYTDRRLLEIIAKILFTKFRVNKIQMLLSCATPLYLTGKYSGLVVSSGASCTQILPIYEGYPLFRCFQYVGIGTTSLNKNIRDQIILQNTSVKMNVLKEITDEQIIDIKISHSSIPAKNQTINVTTKGTKLKFNPSILNYSYLYQQPKYQKTNIAYNFLKSLESIPRQCLKDICSNIVLVGGLWRIKGMQAYFKQNVKILLPNFPKLIDIQHKLKFVSWGFNPSEVAWIGCSIGASIRNISHLCLTKNQYTQNGYIEKIMENYFLSS